MGAEQGGGGGFTYVRTSTTTISSVLLRPDVSVCGVKGREKRVFLAKNTSWLRFDYLRICSGYKLHKLIPRLIFSHLA